MRTIAAKLASSVRSSADNRALARSAFPPPKYYKGLLFLVEKLPLLDDPLLEDPAEEPWLGSPLLRPRYR